MGILAWIHNRGGRDAGDMYGGVDRCASPDIDELYEQETVRELSSKVEVFVADPSEDIAADVAEVWNDAISRYEPVAHGIEVELHASRGMVRLILEPEFSELEELRDMLTSTCQVVGVRDREAESAA